MLASCIYTMETLNRTHLATLHETSHTVWTNLNGWEVPAHYGDPDAEYAALKDGAAIFDFSHWTVLEVTGNERKPFLHGMVSNDVNRLVPGMGNYALFLTPKGKMLADFTVLDTEESLFLYGRESIRENLYGGLTKYLIMEDAEIHNKSEEYALFSVQGSGAEAILKKIDDDVKTAPETYHSTMTSLQGHACRIVTNSHTGYTGYDILVPMDQAEVIWKLLHESGGKPAGQDTLECARIEAGIPIIGKELDDSIIPQEACLHHAVSFDKGCYIGQETVARLHFRGHVNKELTGFFLETEDEPEDELPLHHEGKEVGRITSSVKSKALNQVIALGYLRVKHKQPGNVITAKYDHQEIKATVHQLPFRE